MGTFSSDVGNWLKITIMESKIMRASELIMYVGKKLIKDFNLDDEQRKAIYEQVFYIISGNDKMAEFGHKKGKGVLLIGDIGVGKTIMMRLMQVVFKDSARKFRWVNCMDFRDMLEEGMKPSDIKVMYGKDLKCDLYIDDLGLGQVEHNKYGNVFNIVAEILFERDELFVNDGFLTHLSSNVPTSVNKEQPTTVRSLERLYGDRVLDRIVQLTNLIIWPGKSLRG